MRPLIPVGGLTHEIQTRLIREARLHLLEARRAISTSGGPYAQPNFVKALVETNQCWRRLMELLSHPSKTATLGELYEYIRLLHFALEPNNYWTGAVHRAYVGTFMLAHTITHQPATFSDTETLIRYIEDSVERIVQVILERNHF